MVCLLLRIRVLSSFLFSALFYVCMSVVYSSCRIQCSKTYLIHGYIIILVIASKIDTVPVESVDFTRVIRPQIQVDGLLLQLLYSREYQYIIPSIINPQNTNNS